MSSRRSSGALDMLLLSMLTVNPTLSGYEFATLLREPIPLIWPVKHSQIYPALAALEKRGDIVGEWIEQRGRPNKKLYRISPEGSGRLRDWLTAPRTSITQDEVMLSAYNLRLIGVDGLRAALAMYRRQCEAEKAQLEARWRQIGLTDQQIMVGIRSLYEFALLARDGRITWCEWVLERATAAAPPP
jgi:PadR family transcriptional regulator, regulatory protein AphA